MTSVLISHLLSCIGFFIGGYSHFFFYTDGFEETLIEATVQCVLTVSCSCLPSLESRQCCSLSSAPELEGISMNGFLYKCVFN